MFLCGACLLLVGACIAGPPTVRGCIEGLRVRQGRASNARPYYIIGKVGGVFVWGLQFNAFLTSNSQLLTSLPHPNPKKRPAGRSDMLRILPGRANLLYSGLAPAGGRAADF